jgi:hypothetical protein
MHGEGYYSVSGYNLREGLRGGLSLLQGLSARVRRLFRASGYVSYSLPPEQLCDHLHDPSSGEIAHSSLADAAGRC